LTPERSLVAQRRRRSGCFSKRLSSGPDIQVAHTSWTQEDAGSDNQPDPIGGSTVTLPLLDQARLDVRAGLRAMARDRGPTMTAIASIALGIAATTAMFSVVYAVIIDPFPYKDVNSLASIKVWEPGARGFRTGYTVDQYIELRERSAIFQGVIASTISDVEWTGGDTPQRLRGNHGPFDTFDVMGVAPLVGRTPSAADAARAPRPLLSWAIASGSASSAAVPRSSAGT
jgi:hypothetical protein